ASSSPTPPPSTPGLSPLSLHDALPIWNDRSHLGAARPHPGAIRGDGIQEHFKRGDQVGLVENHQRIRSQQSCVVGPHLPRNPVRSEEHTSELQSRFDLVCRLLLEKKTK